MKRALRRAAMGLAALQLLSGSALAEMTFQGNVVASEVRAVSAPFGGIVDTVDVRVGQPIRDRKSVV